VRWITETPTWLPLEEQVSYCEQLALLLPPGGSRRDGHLTQRWMTGEPKTKTSDFGQSDAPRFCRALDGQDEGVLVGVVLDDVVVHVHQDPEGDHTREHFKKAFVHLHVTLAAIAASITQGHCVAFRGSIGNITLSVFFGVFHLHLYTHMHGPQRVNPKVIPRRLRF